MHKMLRVRSVCSSRLQVLLVARRCCNGLLAAGPSQRHSHSECSNSSSNACFTLLINMTLLQTALGEAVRQEKTQEKDQGVVAIAKKAQDLYKQQQEIIKKADQK